MVPAASSLVIDIGEHVRRRDVVSATLQAQLGRVVVDHIQAFDGSSGRVGFSAPPLVQRLRPRGTTRCPARTNGSSSIVVSNPTDVVADIEVSIVTGRVLLNRRL